MLSLQCRVLRTEKHIILSYESSGQFLTLNKFPIKFVELKSKYINTHFLSMIKTNKQTNKTCVTLESKVAIQELQKKNDKTSVFHCAGTGKRRKNDVKQEIASSSFREIKSPEFLVGAYALALLSDSFLLFSTLPP